MKSLQKRIYNVLGAASTASSPTTKTRARSSSLSSSSRSFHTVPVSPLNFFDSPPPPSPRSSIPSSSRLPVEAKPAEIEGPPHTTPSQTSVSHPPLSLALTQPQSNGGSAFVGNSHSSPGHPSLFSCSLTSAPNLTPTSFTTTCAQQQHVQARKHKPKYQFYVGAYGIPKKCAGPGSTRRRPIPPRTQSDEDMGLAVQVGEDAYFIRDNAMGVADGVGGWAKAKPREILPRRSGASSKTTPSALFARRLMHYCSAEVETLSMQNAPSPLKVPPIRIPPRPHFAFSPPVSCSASTSILMPHATSWQWSDSSAPHLSTPFLSSSLPSQPTAIPGAQSGRDDILALEEDLGDTLEELSEGIDVLQILERAYDRTLKAHVIPAEESSPDATRSPSPTPSAPSSLNKQLLCKPMEMSQSSLNRAAECRPKARMVPLMSGSSTALLAVLDHVAKPEITSESSRWPSISTSLEAEDGYDAVLRIAHVGDCMAMLVRDEEIVWRSEEMWWDFNTPVQLGPSTPTTPRTSAHVFTLPVRADDILILATDGLSDNLWDEDVLDEVVRFRRSFLGRDQEGADNASPLSPASTAAERVLRRRALAGMLSEALCSRARRASERSNSDPYQKSNNAVNADLGSNENDEVPFARRAREAGKIFRGGKNDDISVIVAVISPAADLAEETVSV